MDVAAGPYQTACLLSGRHPAHLGGAQRLLGSWLPWRPGPKPPQRDTTAQVSLSQEAGWAPWAVLAGSVVCLLATGLVTRPRRD